MKNKKDIGVLTFTAIYSVIMIVIFVVTVFILSHEKLQSTEITKYIVETEYVYVAESDNVIDSEDLESDSIAVVESAFETLLVKEYLGKIGVFNAGGELVRVIDVYTKTLPEADRRMLEEGIEIMSEKQLYSIIQDYSS